MSQSWTMRINPAFRVTSNISCGIMESAYSFFLLFCPLFRQRARQFYSSYIWAEDWSLTASSITSRLPGCHGFLCRDTNHWISDQNTGARTFAIPLFKFFSVFSPRSDTPYLSDAFPPHTPLFPPKRRADPGVSFQEPPWWVVQTTGKISSTSSD